jgi:hypothetical protein
MRTKEMRDQMNLCKTPLKYEVVSIHYLNRGLTFYGIYLNTYGKNSQIQSLNEIKRLVGNDPSLTPELRAYLNEQGTAQFLTIREAELIAKLLNKLPEKECAYCGEPFKTGIDRCYCSKHQHREGPAKGEYVED